jgi:hypothetical protein
MEDRKAQVRLRIDGFLEKLRAITGADGARVDVVTSIVEVIHVQAWMPEPHAQAAPTTTRRAIKDLSAGWPPIVLALSQ